MTRGEGTGVADGNGSKCALSLITASVQLFNLQVAGVITLVYGYAGSTNGTLTVAGRKYLINGTSGYGEA